MDKTGYYNWFQKCLNSLYLYFQFKPCPSVNEATGTGNTPLHAAANSGNTEVVEILLSAKGIEVNPQNQQCDGATPLHMAVMHGKH